MGSFPPHFEFGLGQWDDRKCDTNRALKSLGYWSLLLLGTLETLKEPYEQAHTSVLEDEGTHGNNVNTLYHNLLPDIPGRLF